MFSRLPFHSLTLAALTLAFSFSPLVMAEDTPATTVVDEAAQPTKKNSTAQPDVDVWQYLASPFGDTPALTASATTKTTTTSNASVEPTPRKWPDEYWNCLLLNLRGMGSDLAARLVAKACQEKYAQQ